VSAGRIRADISDYSAAKMRPTILMICGCTCPEKAVFKSNWRVQSVDPSR
jgi:hypothetical protein